MSYVFIMEISFQGCSWALVPELASIFYLCIKDPNKETMKSEIQQMKEDMTPDY